MTTIGIDVNLDVCKAEGYMMVAYDARKDFNRDEPYHCKRYFPEWTPNHPELLVDNEYSFNELEEIYKAKKESIDGNSQTYKFVNFEEPTIYDLLHLASDIDSYQGLP